MHVGKNASNRSQRQLKRKKNTNDGITQDDTEESLIQKAMKRAIPMLMELLEYIHRRITL